LSIEAIAESDEVHVVRSVTSPVPSFPLVLLPFPPKVPVAVNFCVAPGGILVFVGLIVSATTSSDPLKNWPQKQPVRIKRGNALRTTFNMLSKRWFIVFSLVDREYPETQYGQLNSELFAHFFELHASGRQDAM
jgi:hypothetical protein